MIEIRLRGGAFIWICILTSQLLLASFETVAYAAEAGRVTCAVAFGSRSNCQSRSRSRTISSFAYSHPTLVGAIMTEQNCQRVYPMDLIPSQVMLSSNLNSALAASSYNIAASDTILETDEIVAPKRVRRRRRHNKKGKIASKAGSKDGNILVGTKSKTHWFDNRTSPTNIVSDGTVSIPDLPWLTSGNLPDIYWRAVSMQHLRQHPQFKPLPLPHTITELKSLEDVNQFRQESWQWDALHLGRCTTSQAVAALGFLEYDAADVLGIPKSWRRGGMGAFVRLKQKPLRTLEEMNRVLCNRQNSDTTADAAETELWTLLEKKREGNSSAFIASYNYQPSKNEMSGRKKEANKIGQNEELGMQIRMMWGNAQEATSLLTALNYFASNDTTGKFYLKESGMCGAGLESNQTKTDMNGLDSSLLIGATPDGVLCHGDGRIEVLEVKNHCPFFSSVQSRSSKKTRVQAAGQRRKRFSIGDRPFDQEKNGSGVFPHYVPQLMMEMLCLGPECKSAIMVRQTATVGALILRMYRDDAWITEMMYWLQRFQNDYVNQNKPPPKNFFYINPNNREEQSRYRRFVNRTLEIRNNVEVVAHIPKEEIQRVQGNTPLFLD